MKVPDITFDAHSTPLGIAFEQGQSFPDSMRHDLFVALHGSYQGQDGRLIANGSKIVRAHRESDGRWTTSDFASGFLTDSLNYLRWARPCGIIFGPNGDLYFTSDHSAPHAAPAVYRIRFTGVRSVHSATKERPPLQVTVLPTSVRIDVTAEVPMTLRIFDALGRTVYSALVSGTITVDTHAWPSGAYIAATGSRTTTFTTVK